MVALAAKEALIPTAAGFDIGDGYERLGTHKEILSICCAFRSGCNKLKTFRKQAGHRANPRNCRFMTEACQCGFRAARVLGSCTSSASVLLFMRLHLSASSV